MINLRGTMFRMRFTGMALLLAVLLVVGSLALLPVGTQAKFRASGAGGCDIFIDALNSPDVVGGDVIMQMLGEKTSDGAVITKNVIIQGGWIHTTSDCVGQFGQVFTDASGFEFQGPMTRSTLFYGAGPVITIDPSVISLTVQHIIFDHQGMATTKGGGISGVISNGARVRLENIAITNSETLSNGGGLYLEVRGGSSLVISDSQFISNTSAAGGGFEIHVYDNSQVLIHNTQVSSNTANSGNGGGGRIVIESGAVTVTNGSFFGNRALAGSGGGLSIEKSSGGSLLAAEGAASLTTTVWLINTSFNNNSAASNPDVHESGAGLTVFDERIYVPLVQKNWPPAVITNITLNGSTYSVDFQTSGFTPQIPGQHVHFFFNTVPPSEAGVPGSGPWIAYGGASPFTQYGVSDRPSGATQMCILVANSDHSVQANSGNCFDLPN
ncbi:MAG: right-handed parallel beta-helix repeat-containing protein [Anaerolineae bacterium]